MKKKFRNLLIATVALLGFTAAFHVQASLNDDPDAVSVQPVSKKELASIKKNYGHIWYHIKFYRTLKPVNVTIKFSDRQNTKLVHPKVLRIPQNTIVSGNKFNDSDKGLVRYSFNLDFDSLSYHLLKPKVSKQFAEPNFAISVTAKSKQSLNRRFKRITTPKYLPTYSWGILNKYPHTPKIDPFTPTTDQLKITPDGNVEFYPIIPGQTKNNQLFSLIPQSFAKINKTIVKGNTRYLYYSHHITGVHDQRVAKSGHYQYRLTMTNLHRPFSLFDGDQGAIILSKYKIGNTVYYTRSGSYSA
ncbi:hypothetical protein [Lentilactobacillus farraginis]|uniref:Extracellular protein n=1 Tax=Lentilactobacillus farraginis DSM 18382 = JCM 14108 TaxID=1423743 RepID=X0PKZ1_9LACO|nr:hypothetical protein [Lentilactobacillus farraginis]KRM03275.1 hypothetical protein FD41_GL001165 [Lentilactobacillus farraginis DSM 18382 = JCM 14108]GAF38027.1 hypothetical protein JCM14108_3124 [Lentilactobacillus farraginis DSM 18382 = JCM 14108]